MPLDCNAPEVLARWLPSSHVRQVETHAGIGGFSGSQICRVTTADNRQLCLRRWPREHPTPERLRLIHSVLTHAAAGGITFVPAPLRTAAAESFVEQAGHLWELTPWLPGAADFRANPSRPRLAAAFESLARFHTASSRPPLPLGEGWGEGLPIFAPAPALNERRELVRTLLDSDFARLRTAVRVGHSTDLDRRADRILSLTQDRLVQLHDELEIAAAIRLPLQPAIRDIHHEHVLFTGDEVTGIIDFGALRLDTPLADVARLAGSLVGDNQPDREFALDAYHQLRPLSTQDRQLIELLDTSGLVLGGLNWLRWLYLDHRKFSDMTAVFRRMDEIIARLELRAASSGR